MIAQNNRREGRQRILVAALVACAALFAKNDAMAKGADPARLLVPQHSSSDVALEGERLLSAVLFTKRLEVRVPFAVCEQTWQDVLTQARLSLPRTNKDYRQILDERSAFLVRNGRLKLALDLFREDMQALREELATGECDKWVKRDIGRISSILRSCDNKPANLAMKEEVLAEVDAVDRSAGAGLHKQIGEFYLKRRKFDKAEMHFQRAVAGMGGSPSSQEDKASVQMSLVESVYMQGQFKRASELCAQVHQTIEKCQDPKQRSKQLVRLATLEINVNNIPKARLISQEALTCLDKSSAGEPELFSALFSVAQTLEKSGDTQNAIRAYKRSIEVMGNNASNMYSAISVLNLLSRLQRNSGDLPGAKASIARSFEIAEKLGGAGRIVQQCLAGELCCLGPLDRHIADTVQSELLTIARKQPDKNDRFSGFCTAATFRIHIGDLAGAELVLSEARTLIGTQAESSSNAYDGVIFMRSGQVATASGRTAEAHTYLATAEKIFLRNRAKMLSNIAQNCRSMGTCYWLEGDEVKSMELRKRAYDLYREANSDARTQLWASLYWYFTYYCLPPQVIRSPVKMAHMALQAVKDTSGAKDSIQIAIICLSLSDLLTNAGYATEAKPFLDEAISIRKKRFAKRVD